MNELAIAGIPSSQVVVAHIRADLTEHVWNTSTLSFESYDDVTASEGTYDVSLVEQASSGYYVGDFPEDITTAGMYNIAYYSIVDAEYVYESASSLSWTGSEVDSEDGTTGIDWITLAEYKNWKRYSDVDETRDAAIEAAITYASAICNEYLGRTIKQSPHSKVFRGKSHATSLFLGEYPVNSITSITFEYYTGNEQSVEGGEFYVNDQGTVRWKPSSTNLRYFDSYYLHAIFSAGYSTVPADLKQACMLVVSSLLYLGDDEQVVASHSVKDVKYAYTDITMADPSDPILGTAKRLLDRHKDPKIVM